MPAQQSDEQGMDIYKDPFSAPERDSDPEWLKQIRESVKKFKEKQAQEKSK